MTLINSRPSQATDPSPRRGPLAGVRIVDLTTVVLGPFATRILGDLGADVIKVETLQGDSTRGYKPLRNAGMSGMFLNLNRNKRSICLDLRTPEGRDVLKTLIGGADVFIHNMRPAAIERLGFGYAQVRAIRPEIIFCGAYGFGANGPYRDKAAYDDLIQAGSGLSSLVEKATGEAGYAPTVICDKLAGQAAAYAVLAALFQRATGGGGQAIEVPMFETSIDFFSVEHTIGAAFAPPLAPMGNPRVLSRQRRPYPTADGFACILPYSDRNWLDFFEFIGRPELARDPRFATLHERVLHVDELYAVIAEAAVGRTTQEWVDFCDAVSIPCMPVLDIDRLEDDPHLQAVGLFSIEQHPSEGPYRLLRSPVGFSNADCGLRQHAPRLGQHSREILQEAGLDARQVETLIGRGVVRTEPDTPVEGGAVDAGI